MPEGASPMRSLVPDEMDSHDAYRLMVSVVVPRPIAWVSTIGADGVPNLAPFSFFNGVAGPPPIVMFSPELRDGAAKDTLRNVRETGEFVLNLADEALGERMVLTSGDWPREVSEFALAGLAAAPSVDVRPPRVAEAAVAMEARVTQVVPVEGTDYTMVLGRLVRFHIREGLLRENGLVDAALLRPLARLGGSEYATIGRIITLRPPRDPAHAGGSPSAPAAPAAKGRDRRPPVVGHRAMRFRARRSCSDRATVLSGPVSQVRVR